MSWDLRPEPELAEIRSALLAAAEQALAEEEEEEEGSRWWRSGLEDLVLETVAPANAGRPLPVGADESAPWARELEPRRHSWTGH